MNPNTALETEDESREKRKLLNVERIKEGGKDCPSYFIFPQSEHLHPQQKFGPSEPESFRRNSAVLSFIKEWKEGNCPLMAEFSPAFPGKLEIHPVRQAELTYYKYATEIDATENKFIEAWVRFPFLLFYFVLRIGKSEQ